MNDWWTTFKFEELAKEPGRHLPPPTPILCFIKGFNRFQYIDLRLFRQKDYQFPFTPKSILPQCSLKIKKESSTISNKAKYLGNGTLAVYIDSMFICSRAFGLELDDGPSSRNCGQTIFFLYVLAINNNKVILIRHFT